jgi:hypothetical protein
MRRLIGATLLAVVGAGGLGTLYARQKDNLVDFCHAICSAQHGCERGACLRACITGKAGNHCK